MTLTIEVRAALPDDVEQWLSTSFGSSLLVARTARLIPESASDYGITIRTYDGWLNAPIDSNTSARIAGDVFATAQDRGTDNVVYLAGSFGGVADVTVERLADRASITSTDAAIPFVPGPVTIIDALAIAEAHTATPYDAGLLALDRGSTIIVTNWYGNGVIAAATSLLLARLGLAELPAATADGCVVIPRVQHAEPSTSVAELRQIYARLRRPDGCPWDREQSEASTLNYISEEVDELRQALANSDSMNAAEELGDILGNVVMVAQIAEEHGLFTFEDAVTALTAKLVRRHPHVFGEERATSPDEVLNIWNRVKQQERQSNAGGGSTNA